MKKKFLIILIPFLCLSGLLYPGEPKPYKTSSKSIENGYVKTVITHYTPIVKYGKVAVLKSYYAGGILYKQDIVYERRPLVTWRMRSEYKYAPLIRYH